jgi:membrane protein implicated in regulation of membrane protease activity
MIEFITSNLWVCWTIVMFCCLILELSSGDFFVTCFAIGAFVTIFTSFILPFWAQVLVWALFSILSIRLIRPRLIERLHNGGEDRLSNIDALIGRVGTVIETIEPNESGYVKVDGDEWKAVCNSTESISKGQKVEIISRESIIVTVKPV